MRWSILTKQPRIKFIPIYFCAFVVDLSIKVAEKIQILCYFQRQTHAPTKALYFSQEEGGRALWTIWGTGN